ncbi:MAG: intradiol ring-cleavage dioxygenase [Thermodesulfovibrio sp.]|nr:intradiol ring-cleavage dioxygenase [Thermodesulfovibrio sp.]
MDRRYCLKFFFFFAFTLLATASFAEPEKCRPTEPDELGPFYRAGAPVRASVGKGYILTGTVRSSKGCSAIRNAEIELWLVGPDVKYDAAHRATVISDDKGAFRFESNYPKPYVGRPPHIHLRVTAKGFIPLVTQHYPAKGKSAGVFDLVLMPE